MKNKKTLKIAVPTILGAGLAAAVPFALTSCSSKPATPTMDIAETGMTQSSFEAFYNEFNNRFSVADSRAIDGKQITDLVTNGINISSEQILNADSSSNTTKAPIIPTSGKNFIGILKLLNLKNFSSVNVKLNNNNGQLSQRNQFVLPLQISINFNNDINLVNGESQWQYKDKSGNLNIININKNILTINMKWTSFSISIQNLSQEIGNSLLNKITNFKFPTSITGKYQEFVVNNTNNSSQYNELNKIINLPSTVVKSYTFILKNASTNGSSGSVSNKMKLVITFNEGFIPNDCSTSANVTLSNGADMAFWPSLKSPVPGFEIIPGFTEVNNGGIVISDIQITNQNTPSK